LWREGNFTVHILKVVQAYYPFQEKGGPVVKVRAIARGLAKRGHQITVLTADLGLKKHNEFETKAERCQWGWRWEQDGVETVFLSTLGQYRALTLNPRVIGFCRASIRRFDVVHLYGFYDLLAPAVSHFCRRHGIPYLIEPMGMYRPIVRSIHSKKMYHYLLGNRSVWGAQFLIATSEQEKEELIAGGIDASRIVVRRNGIDPPEKLPARGAFRQRWNIAETTRMILFLGRLVSKKSPDLLLEAFSGWRSRATCGEDTILVLAGPEERDAFASRLKSMAAKLGLNRSVLFPGPLYNDAKWQAYRDADVFILPSQNENFGNTAGESAACGTPVIVTARCGIAPFVGRAGIVISHDRFELERALGQLLDDSALRQRCQEGCGEMTRSLSWKDPLDQSEKLYEQCLQKRPDIDRAHV
jgi:glycosyltransferase involved in cell wall biosynthesis